MAMYTKEQRKKYGEQFSEKERSSYSAGRSAAIKDLVRLAKGYWSQVTDNSLKAAYKAIVLAAYNEGVWELERKGGLKDFIEPLDQESRDKIEKGLQKLCRHRVTKEDLINFGENGKKRKSVCYDI